MSVKAWRNGLHCEEFEDGRAQTFRLGKPTNEQRGTAERPSHLDVRNHSAEEWAAMKETAKAEDEAAEKAAAAKAAREAEEAEKRKASAAPIGGSAGGAAIDLSLSAAGVKAGGASSANLIQPAKPKKGPKAK